MTEPAPPQSGAPADPRLGRMVRFDEASRAYPVRALLDRDAGGAVRAKSWRVLRPPLDQLREGMCTGTGAGHWLAAAPKAARPVTLDLARQLYFGGQRRDPWPGGAYPGADPRYEGGTVLGVVQELVARGEATSYRWTFGEEDLWRTVATFSPVILGLTWRAGMMEPDARGYIHDDGPVVGGHCLLAYGVQPGTRVREPYYLLRQSWGIDHGIRGTVLITRADMAARLADNGEGCVPLKP